MATWHDLHLRRFPVPAALPRRDGSTHIHNWFSNMEPMSSCISFAGQQYMTSEALFQALKSPPGRPGAVYRARCAGMSPFAAKRAGRDIAIRRGNWYQVQMAAMWTALVLKWAPERPEHQKLRSAPALLVEWTNWGRTPGFDGPGDRIWGVGAATPGDGVGHNTLGLMLTTLRHMARKGRWPSVVHDEERWPVLQRRLVDTLNAIPAVAGSTIIQENGPRRVPANTPSPGNMPAPHAAAQAAVP